MEVPADFVDLAVAHGAPDGTFVNVIGVVVDLLPPIKSRNDFVLTFNLLDQKMSRTFHEKEGVRVRFFRRYEDELPKVRGVGDVVLLRSVKMSTFRGVRIGLSNYQTGFLVFPSAAIPGANFSIGFHGTQKIAGLGKPIEVDKFNLLEQQYIIHLKEVMATAVETAAPRPQVTQSPSVDTSAGGDAEPPAKRQKTTSSFGAKFRLVEELREKTFADVCGIVVKSFGATWGCDLYVTDFTSNEALRYYTPPEEETEREREGDTFGYTSVPKRSWPGPYGQRVLKINVKQPHAGVARNLHEGELVLLRNVKMRTTTESHYGMFLEGDMWPDHLSRDQVNVRTHVDRSCAEVQAIWERQRAYEQERSASASSAGGAEPAQTAHGKKRRKKLKKQDKQDRQRARREAESCDGEPEQTVHGSSGKPAENGNVRCMHQEIPVTSIRTILDPTGAEHRYTTQQGVTQHLPFINARYRARVRVVDFVPRSLADFAVPAYGDGDGDGDGDGTDDNGNDDHDHDHDRDGRHRPRGSRFTWHFCLLLEDASRPAAIAASAAAAGHDRIWVHVEHSAAQFLLGNAVADPADLHADARLQSAVREQMFLLWGNVEEEKTRTRDEEEEEEGGEEAVVEEEEEVGRRRRRRRRRSGQPRNLPFECCIEEYGVAVSGDGSQVEHWQRRHGMFGVTIV